MFLWCLNGIELCHSYKPSVTFAALLFYVPVHLHLDFLISLFFIHFANHSLLCAAPSKTVRLSGEKALSQLTQTGKWGNLEVPIIVSEVGKYIAMDTWERDVDLTAKNCANGI